MSAIFKWVFVRLHAYDGPMTERRVTSNSRARQFVEVGGIELTLGGLWLLASLQAVLSEQFSGMYFLVDLLAFVALGLGTRTLAFGLGSMVLALVVALLLPPGVHGYVGVFAFIMVITFVRRHRLWLAFGLTVITLVVGTWLSFRASDEVSLGEAMVAWFLAALIAWALSIGSRAQAQLSVLNEREKYVRERVDFAWDLHDFVARDLTIISMRVDSAIARGGADVEELQLIAEHSRAANKFLRETAKQFGDSGLPSQHRAVTIASAVETAKAELAATGRSLAVNHDCPAIPRMVDAVGGRILLEALHNAVKHGSGPVTVTCANEGDELEIVVRNQLSSRSVARASRGMGLAAMRQRATMFGGTLVAGPLDAEWVSTIRLPYDEHTSRGNLP